MWDTGHIFSYDNHKTKTMLNWWWYVKMAGLYWRCIEMSHLPSSLVLCLFRKCVQNCVQQRTANLVRLSGGNQSGPEGGGTENEEAASRTGKAEVKWQGTALRLETQLTCSQVEFPS